MAKRAVFITGIPETGKTTLAKWFRQKGVFVGVVSLDSILYKCCEVAGEKRIQLAKQWNKKSKHWGFDTWAMQSEFLKAELLKQPYDYIVLDGFHFRRPRFVRHYMDVLRGAGYTEFALHHTLPNTLPLENPLYKYQVTPQELLPALSVPNADYQDYWFVKQPHARVSEKLVYLPAEMLRGKTVLDVGCNAGYVSLWCATRGASSVVGVDAEDKYLATARVIKSELMSEFPVVFVKADAQTLASEDMGTFDYVLCLAMLHYVKDYRPVIAQFASLTKLGMVLEVPTIEGCGEYPVTIDGSQWMYARAELVSWLERHFRSVKVLGTTWKPAHPSSWNAKQLALYDKTVRHMYLCEK